MYRVLPCGPICAVGGGSAGAVLANRLSENPDWKVLLVEAGGSESQLSDIPLVAATVQQSALDWKYRTVTQEAACFALRDGVNLPFAYTLISSFIHSR